MLRLFQKLTKELSIKMIVLLGVVIMGIMIVTFGITIYYLSSTIKYDQDTLKNILNFEQQNQEILNIIKDRNFLHNKIIIIKEANSLKDLEKEINKTILFKKITNSQISLNEKESYNEKIDALQINFENLLSIESDEFEKRSTIILYNDEINSYKNLISKYLNQIEVETESIYGKALLLIKREARKNKENKESLRLNKILTISSDLNISMLKLSVLVHSILNTENKDLLVSIKRNSISQLYTSIEVNLLKLLSLNIKENEFKKSIEKIKYKFNETSELINALLLIKQQLFIQEKEFDKLIAKHKTISQDIYLNMKSIAELSKQIKFSILNHSDNISKRTTIVIVLTGFLCLTLLFITAITLISRINIPLEFMMRFMDSIISRKRKLSSKIPIFTKDEFAKLSKSFNKMTSTIDQNIHEIHDLYNEIEDTQKEVVFTMGAIGETRSKETGNHVRRVAEYSKILAIKYGLSEKIAELLKEASPMHDIGKVGIPDSILKKEGTLDSSEWKVMKTHAQLGYEMLKHSNRDIFKTASIVAYEHHEKWDGSGYPRGLKGEEIHIYGRITAVADVFDALGSDRCYKKAWELEDIFDYFKANSGTHFDPKLVELFFENIDEFLYIRDKYKDVF